jgi:hypothetical protein
MGTFWTLRDVRLKLGAHQSGRSPTVAADTDPRGCDLPTCPARADSMVAAEGSAFVSDNVISHLWTCDTCGYGLVTKHALRRFACY